MRGAWHRDAGHALASAGAAPDRVARQLLRALGWSAAGGSAGNGLNPANQANQASILTGVVSQRNGPGSAAAAGSAENVAAPSIQAAGAGSRVPATPGSSLIEIERPPVGASPHWPAGASQMDGWMLDWLATSADSLVGQAPGVAAELLGQAVAGTPAGSIKHGWLASRLADALFRTGDRAEAERVAERALGYADDPDLIVDLHWTLTQCRMLGGAAEDSFATLKRALATPGISAKHRARLLVLAARTYLYLGEVEAAAREADRALAAATEGSDTWATGWALHVLAIMATIRGDLTAALPLYDRALAVTETDPALNDLGLLLQVNKAVTLFNLDHCDEALTTAERARQLADQVGTAIRQAQTHGVLGQLLYETGRWDDALTEIAIVPEDLKEPGAACVDLGIAAVINFHRSAPDSARRYLTATEPYIQRIGQRSIPSHLMASSFDREQAGDQGEALAILTAAFGGSPEDIGEIEELFVDAVRLAVKTGDKEAAQSLTRQAATLAEGSEIPHQQANALYCRGMVDRDSGVLLAAAQRYADAGRPLPRAKALEAAAERLVEAEERTAARQAFEQAVEVYEFLGAEADLNRVHAEFRAYGIRRGPHSKHRRAVSGWDSLTGTELKVAAFVEEGLSNPEIAARLMLSRRTVATHVSHILKKLNLTTRTDIASGIGAARRHRQLDQVARQEKCSGACSGVPVAQATPPLRAAGTRKSGAPGEMGPTRRSP